MNEERARVERCMAAIAHYLATEGDPGFLQYFEYLERELEKLSKTESARDRALRMAKRL